jgi:hypothetical protein
MFLIGISGSFLPYLFLLGVVVVLSVPTDTSIFNNAENTRFDVGEKHIIYEYPDVAWSYDADNALLVDFYSFDKCRGNCSGKQQLFSFVEFLPAFRETVTQKRSLCFISRFLSSQHLSLRFSGLSPPLLVLLG